MLLSGYGRVPRPSRMLLGFIFYVNVPNGIESDNLSNDLIRLAYWSGFF